MDGNLGLVNAKFIEKDEREKLIKLMLPFGVVPAGRHLYASGIQGKQYLNNCHGSGFSKEDPALHFSFMFDQLMQGGGVGSNYSDRYMEFIPKIQNSIDLHIICRSDHANIEEFRDLLSTHISDISTSEIIKVEDSREGWVVAFHKMMQIPFNEGSNKTITFDVSGIRERGKPLVTSGGIACGPGPLVKMLHNTSKILNSCYNRYMNSLEVMEIDHACAECVIAGGKRRSSRMSVKNWKDKDIFSFINCKMVDGFHWTTNISIEVDDEFFEACSNKDVHALAVRKAGTLLMRVNGEPGFWNISLARKGERNPKHMFCPNPCGEISFEMWENCCLGHINLGYFANKRGLEATEAFRLMTRWLVRATFGDIPQQKQREIVDQNRRIGVGFFGFHEWLALKGIKYSECFNNKEVLDSLAVFRHTVENESTSYAKSLGIPVPVKCTTIAPTGTIAIMPGTTTGPQALLYKHFKRLVRYATMDPLVKVKKEEGYEVFTSKNEPDTEIVAYWCEDPLVAKVRAAGFDPEAILENQDDISFETSLKVQAMLQEVWSDNSISYTINLKKTSMPSEEKMEELLGTYLPKLKGTTVFPEMSREDAPFQPLTKEQWDNYKGRKEIMMIEYECKTGCPIL